MSEESLESIEYGRSPEGCFKIFVETISTGKRSKIWKFDYEPMGMTKLNVLKMRSFTTCHNKIMLLFGVYYSLHRPERETL